MTINHEKSAHPQMTGCHSTLCQDNLQLIESFNSKTL